MPVTLDAVLAANALVSLDEVKAYLSVTRTTDPLDLSLEDAQLVDGINWVSAWVESYARPMARKTETLRLAPPRAPHLLRLARQPIVVTEPVTVAVADAAPLLVWRTEDDGARSGFDVLVYASVPGSPWCPDALFRRGGWGLGGCGHWLGCSCGGYNADVGGDPQPILVTYTGGFDCIPETGVNQLPNHVRVAVLDTVRAWTRNQQQGTSDVVAIAQPGGGPQYEIPRWIPHGAYRIFTEHRPVYAAP